MINEKTDPKTMLAEIFTDRKGALHALKKSYGGRSRMDAALVRMAHEVVDYHNEGESIFGNIELYTSGRTGNHWASFALAENVGFGHAVTGVKSFAYWDTDDGSIGIVVLNTTSRKGYEEFMTIYTGHFFQRYAEREHLGTVDLQLVCDFMQKNSCAYKSTDDEADASGRYRFDIMLLNGIGRGYSRQFTSDDGKVMLVGQVRTYLPNSMLNQTQRETTAEYRGYRASLRRPGDTIVSLMMNGDDDALIARTEDIFCSRGCKSGFGVGFLNLLRPIMDVELSRPADSPSETELGRRMKIYNRFCNTAFRMVDGIGKQTWTVFDTIFCCLTAVSDYDAKYAVLFFIRAEYAAIGMPQKEQERFISVLDAFLSKPENKLTRGNIVKVMKRMDAEAASACKFDVLDMISVHSKKGGDGV